MLQIGAVFIWSYVYNMVRISSNSIGEKIIDNPQHTPKLPDENTDDKPSSQSELISDCPAEQRLPITVSAESSTKTKVFMLHCFRFLACELVLQLNFVHYLFFSFR